MLFVKRLEYRACAVLNVLRVQKRASKKLLFAKQLNRHARAVVDVLRVQERAPTIRKTIKMSRARFWMFYEYRKVLLLLGK